MADRIRITAAVHDALIDAAKASAPNECCGVLGSRDGLVVSVIPVANVAAEPTSKYALDPAGLVAARATARRDGLEVAGFYHSHPRTSPELSSYDVANAWYPESVYVVIGLEPRPAVSVYRIADGQSHALEFDLEPS